jgi:putative nucleotidyltransferase with HDIG domain
MITKQDIERVFKDQLEKIKDKGLREKVVKTWVKGCSRGKWDSIIQLEKMPFTLLINSKEVSFIEHTIAVTEGAVHLARAQLENYKHTPYGINFDNLYAGGLLHDVGKLMEVEPDGKGGYQKSLSGKYSRHPISGGILAAECGLPESIINIITCHSSEGKGRPQTIETVFIHQADFAAFKPLAKLEKGLLIE